MKSSLLYKIWLALPESARKISLKAARSPLLNERSEVTTLLEWLDSRAQTSKDLSKQSAFQCIYGANAAYDDNKMRRLLSYSLDLVRRCLAWEQWSDNQAAMRLHACRALRAAGLNDLFEKEIRSAREALEADPRRSDAYFFDTFALEQELWEQFRQSQRSRTGDVQALNTSFAVFVAINALRQGCTLLAQKTVVNVTATVPYLQETLRLCAEGTFDGLPAVAAWQAGYLAMTEPEKEAHFLRLKQHIEQHSRVFPASDLRDLYILALNVCIRRINLADHQYIREAFDLYRGGLGNGVFLEHGFLSKFTYRNILKSAIALDEWEWALQYLHEFQQYLPPKEQENIFRYNLATYYFRKSEYEKTLELLRHVEFHDMLENFDSRRMLLRCYYALSEWDALSYLLDSFNIYLQRHKEGGYHREMYKNLVRFAKKITAAGPQIQRRKIAEEIRRTEYVAEREWLLSELGQG